MAKINKEKRQYDKEYREKNKEEIKEKNRKYYIKKREVILKRCKEYRETHKEQIAEYHKKNYLKNKAKILKKTSEYKKNHRKQTNKNARELRKKNPNKYKEQSKKRFENGSYRLLNAMRNRVWELCFTVGVKRRKHTIKYLGCSKEQFIRYFESLFQEGMDWDNYGSVWHVDHRIPASHFDLTKESEREICFSYKNLKPMFASENISKNNRYAEKLYEGEVI